MLLVTGGAGFIGSHLIDRLLERGDRVLCVDDFDDFYDPLIKRRNTLRHRDYAAFAIEEGDMSLLERVSGRKAKVRRLPSQPGDVNITYADISKARRMLNYDPATPFEEGITKFVHWFEQTANVAACV